MSWRPKHRFHVIAPNVVPFGLSHQEHAHAIKDDDDLIAASYMGMLVNPHDPRVLLGFPLSFVRMLLLIANPTHLPTN